MIDGGVQSVEALELLAAVGVEAIGVEVDLTLAGVYVREIKDDGAVIAVFGSGVFALDKGHVDKVDVKYGIARCAKAVICHFCQHQLSVGTHLHLVVNLALRVCAYKYLNGVTGRMYAVVVVVGAVIFGVFGMEEKSSIQQKADFHIRRYNTHKLIIDKYSKIKYNILEYY